jgi:hypothetical protein
VLVSSGGGGGYELVVSGVQRSVGGWTWSAARVKKKES